MNISVTNPSFYFIFFYVLSFVSIFTLVIIVSLRRKYPLRSVLLMLTTISLLTIIGSRLFTIPLSEWSTLISNGAMPEHNSRSAIGGLLFGLGALLFTERYFSFKRPVLDLYAWIAPLALGIQKIGCFLNGCCYGQPSELFWSVQYPSGTHAHYNHWTAGMIEQDAHLSYSVHPVQLYEMLFFFGAAFLVWRTRKLWMKKESSILFSLSLFLLFRFGIEFIRDPASSQFNENYFLGVRIFQWVLLLVGILIVMLLVYYENSSKKVTTNNSYNGPKLNNVILYIVLISVVIFIFRGLFSRFEMLLFALKFIPAIVLTSIQIYDEIPLKKYRLITGTLLIIPFILFAQAIPKNKENIEKYKRLDLGTSWGSRYTESRYSTQEGECGTSYTTENYKHEFRAGGAGLSLITKTDQDMSTFGINLFGVTSKETNLTTATSKSSFNWGINPYVKYDMSWVGLGAGFHIGDLKWVTEDFNDEQFYGDGSKSSWVYPEYYVRLGRRDILDITYEHGFNFPTPFPAITDKLSIGSGFGLPTDYSFRFGVANPTEAKFISAEGLINKQWGAHIMYIYDERELNYSSEKQKPKFVFGVNYRFDFKNK